MKHRLAFFFIALLSCLSISAQKFELDPLWGDSVESQQYRLNILQFLVIQ